jgi:hypothetical protein
VAAASRVSTGLIPMPLHARGLGKGTSSGQGGGGVARSTAAPRRPPRAYGLVRGGRNET